MKQDRDWIDAMRSSLRDAEPTPPSGGWKRLERELEAVKPSVPAWRIYWPRIAAAAAVLFCVVAGDILLRERQGVMTDGNVITSAADGGVTAADNPTLKETTTEFALAVRAGEPVRQASVWSAVGGERTSTVVSDVVKDSGLESGSAAGSVQEAVHAGMPARAVDSNSPASGEGTAFRDDNVISPASSAGQEVSQKRTISETRTVVGGQSTPGRNLHKAYGEDLFAENTPRRNKTSIGLFAGGGMLGGRENAPQMRMFASALAPGSNEIVGSQKLEYSDYSYRHHLPVSFGLAVRKDFLHGFSIETGVNYTLLLSDVKAQYGSKDISQKLHFIGVPLRFNWRFFERNRFSLYLGVGGMLEKCVAAKFGSRDVAEDKLQWSAFAAAGAQYRLGGVAALYFEPEASYYFTETTLRTVRTDSPVAFSLRLGLRLSF